MNLKENIDSHVIWIIDRLQKAGYEAYLVGGAVRDLMLDRHPKDYDLSTSATPEQIRDLFGRRNARIIGKRFRLVHVYHGNEIIEVTTFRKAPKVDEEGTVLPFDNEFGNSMEDAWRRDFSVNAIFYDPLSDQVIDHTEMGVNDLENKIVRTLGSPSERFEEDPVRMLRALKLVGQYGFKLEPETQKALRSSLPYITHCSHSRLSLELEKIMRRPYSEEILKAFHEHGFLAYYLPYLNECWETEECSYMLELIHERNNRLMQGKYRDSISLAIATAALPFAEAHLEADPEGRGWIFYFGVEKDLKRIIRNVFSPYNFPKRIVASALGMLLLQPSMLNKRRQNRVLSNRRYRHARELMMLQNNTKWHDESLNEFWPKHGKRGGRRRKDGSKSKKNK
jgi:poly(A) polymerase